MSLGKILIVDDEPDIVEIVSLFVESFGYEYLTASGGNNALELIKANPDIDAVISDVMMPEGTGVDLIKAIRAEGLQIPFIFLTAYASKDYTLEGLRMGVFELIDKPFEADNIKRVLENAMKSGSEAKALRKLAEESGQSPEGVANFCSEYKNQLYFCKGAVGGLSDDENKTYEISYILRVLQNGEGECAKLGLASLNELLSAAISYLSCCRMEIELVGREEINFIGKIVDEAVDACAKTEDALNYNIDQSIIKEISEKSREFEENILN